METGLSECCLKGHLHEGTPTGTIEKINGLAVYIAKSETSTKAKTVLSLTDVFGWAVPNARLLADEYAQAGFFVYMPDFHQGESIPLKMQPTIQPLEPQNRTPEQAAADTKKTGELASEWLTRHGEDVVRPLIDKFVEYIRAGPETGKLGAVGFCWGAKYTLDLADAGSIDAAVGNHPSFFTESEFTDVIKPTQINVGDNDNFMSNEVIAQTKAAMEQKTHVPFKVNVIPGAVHGFAVRGDLKSPREKEIKEEALALTVGWLNKYLV